jgi:uncharacterized protein YbjT (DUF2867 family)
VPTILVTGATGYVGGRLVASLVGEASVLGEASLVGDGSVLGDGGITVRCLARTPAKLDAAPWRSQVEVAEGSVGDLGDALEGVDVAVYLVHSIGQGSSWQQQERQDAASFAAAAKAAGVERIVYLGGLGREGDDLSNHLRSRHEVGAILADHGVDTIELRAGVIIGSGSASFEMLRYLVEVLPIMVTPRWVSTRCQPIAIADVVRYLHLAVVDAGVAPGIYEIGGPDVLSYADVMRVYAEAIGLPRRRLIPVPLLTPSLSAHWVGLVTPVPVPLARELVQSLVNEVTVGDERARTAFDVEPMSLRTAFNRATAALRNNDVPTTFLNADLVHFAPVATDPDWAGGTSLTDIRQRTTTATPDALFDTVSGLGGEKGWYSATILWQIRGVMDKLIGGPGLRKGRKSTIAVGDSIDFWRVEALSPDRSLVLRAEMVLPGRAWLRWDISAGDTDGGDEDAGDTDGGDEDAGDEHAGDEAAVDTDGGDEAAVDTDGGDEAAGDTDGRDAHGGGADGGDGSTEIIQTAEFRPKGLLGRVYWLGVAPFHRFIFPVMLNGIVADAERAERLMATPPRRTVPRPTGGSSPTPHRSGPSSSPGPGGR